MTIESTLREKILLRLCQVIDPETGIDVVRMRLIEGLEVDEAGGVIRYIFRPSSPLCPLAAELGREIRQAIAGIAGVNRQEIQVLGYVRAEELTAQLNAA